jgi:hypothetical protein
VPFLISAFRSNPQLGEVLAKATSTGTTFELRHAALENLRTLGQESRADLIAMRILDVEQAPKCSSMRAAWKELRGLKDPRVKALIADLKTRGRKDPHVKCLRRMLRR